MTGGVERQRMSGSKAYPMPRLTQLSRSLKRVETVVLVACGVLAAVLLCSPTDAKGSEVSRSMIQPCPNKPNCVSSLASQGPRRMEPIPFAESWEQAKERLLAVVRSFPRTTLVKNEGYHVQAEFRSAVFSFVDDVDFVFDGQAKVIHFRSASRVGYYDFGVNRRRMEEVIRRFSAK